MLISEMEDRLHTFDYIEGFVVMNNQDLINGLKSVPFSPDADQAVSGMSNNMLPSTVAASSVLYYLEAAVGYNLVDVGPVLENVKTLLQHPVDPSSSAFVLHDLLLFSLRRKKKTRSSMMFCKEQHKGGTDSLTKRRDTMMNDESDEEHQQYTSRTPREVIEREVDFVACKGTYSWHHKVVAFVVGLQHIIPPSLDATDHGPTVEVRRQEEHGAVPEPGVVVTAKIRKVQPRMVVADVRCVGTRAVRENFEA